MRSEAQLQPPRDGALSFFAIGAGEPPDAATYIEDLVVAAIGRRHPAS